MHTTHLQFTVVIVIVIFNTVRLYYVYVDYLERWCAIRCVTLKV